MAWPQLAKIDTLELPPQFSYHPYIPKKRNSVTPTANAVVTQYSNPQIVHGDGTLAWNIEACYPSEFQALYSLYDTATPVLYTFTGYWGEVMTFYFSTLDEPKVRARFFQVSGMFQIIDIITPYNPSCEQPEEEE